MEKLIDEFEKLLQYKFNNKQILVEALTHSSYANEHNLPSNERLEFLGDAVLELSMSRHLFSIENLENEGVLTKTRAKAVCEEALNIYASKINLSKYILLGKGEENSGGRNRPAIIADAFESFLGAVFLDGGFEEAYKVVKRLVIPYYNSIQRIEDYKSILQEKLQSEKRNIRYELIKEEGPANNKLFEFAVYMDDIQMGRGVGKTKKEAQQNAAKNALEKEAKN